MKNKVSVIMPVYNVEKHIAKSIQSVLNQTFIDFELLIVDDGSPDRSIAVAQQFDDARIKIVHKSNGGLSDARNFGLEKAGGEFVYFIDSDDWIEPNLLEVCVSEMQNKKADYLVFGYFLDAEDANGNLLNQAIIDHKAITFSKSLNNLVFSNNTLGLMGYAWNKMYLKSFILENKLQFEKGTSLIEDILFNTNVYSKSDKIIFLDHVLYHYIDRPAISLIKKFHTNSFELVTIRNRAVENFLIDWNVSHTLKNSILSNMLVTGIRYCSNNLFAFKNDLSFLEKYNYLKMMLNHPETKKYGYFYQAKSTTDKLYRLLITTRATVALYVLCKLKK